MIEREKIDKNGKNQKQSGEDFSLPSLISLISTDSGKNYEGGSEEGPIKKKKKK